MTWIRLLCNDNQRRYVKVEKIGVLFNSFFSKQLASMIEPNWAVTLDSLHRPIRNIRLDISCPNERNKGGKDGDGQCRLLYSVTSGIYTRDDRLRRIWSENGFSSDKRALHK